MTKPPVVVDQKSALEYFEWLATSGYSYHIDDDIDDISWSQPVDNELRNIMKLNHDAMWEAYSNDQHLIWDAYYRILVKHGIMEAFTE